MQIYFGKITDDFMLESGDWLEFENESYAFVLEMDEECLVIKDSIGRMVPVSLEDINALYDALSLAKLVAEHVAHTNSILESSTSV